MKRKRTHPRLPNGLGSIKYLGKGRSNPYAVYPPEHKVTDGGSLVYKRALCYVPDWYTGFAVLISYRAGNYHPGDELDIPQSVKTTDFSQLDGAVRKIIADYMAVGKKQEALVNLTKHTFSDVFDEYYNSKFGEYTADTLSAGSQKQYRAAFRQWDRFHDRYIEDISRVHLQDQVNEWSDTYSANTLHLRLAVIKCVFGYAVTAGYISSNPCDRVKIPAKAKKEEHAIPYTSAELKKIWKAANKGNDTAKAVLIQTYSGFRVSAFNDMKVDLKNGTLTGGVKTGTRTIPIHPAILGFIKDRTVRGKLSLWSNQRQINMEISNLCSSLDIRRHSSHSARHTFKMLCDRYGVNPVAARYMMGHSLKYADVHDAVYSHFEIEDLRKELNKIVV